MKTILLEIINNDISYNKSATRYLYKTHPALWQQVVNKTSFLPDVAKAKQRIWHVLNDVYEIPLCPVENVPVKWWENRYLTTSSRAAKTQLQHSRGDFKNLWSDEINQKRKISNISTAKKGRKYRDQNSYTEQQKQKNAITCFEKYGVANGSQSVDARKKISQARIQNGATPYHLRSLRRFYYDAVKRYTKESWKQDFDKINPNSIRRSENALDHIYSIQQGFYDHIPPYIIGHWTNLRVMPMVANSVKGMRCDKTQNQLFEDFFACIN